MPWSSLFELLTLLFFLSWGFLHKRKQIAITFCLTKVMKDFDQPWCFSKFSIENQFYKKSSNCKKLGVHLGWPWNTIWKMCFLVHLFYFYNIFFFLNKLWCCWQLYYFGECFKIHKRLDVSVSTFHERFSICNSVSTITSFFFSWI